MDLYVCKSYFGFGVNRVVQKELEHPLGVTLTPNRAHLSPQQHRQTLHELIVKIETLKSYNMYVFMQRTYFKREVKSDIS